MSTNPTYASSLSINSKVDAYAVAYTQGSNAAIIETAIGNIFHGAYRSAELAGYEKGSHLFKMYVSGYLSETPYSVSLDDLQRITSIRSY